MRSIYLFALIVGLQSQLLAQTPIPDPPEPMAPVLTLPDLPPLPFEGAGNGKVTLDESQFRDYVLARNERDRQILQEMRQNNDAAESLIQQNDEVKSLLRAETVKKEVNIKLMNEIAANFNIVVERLQRAEQNLSATQGQLAAAQNNVNAAYAALEHEKGWAMVPAPISTVLRLFMD